MATSRKTPYPAPYTGPALRAIRLRPQQESVARAIQEELNLHPVIARVLAARGMAVGDELKNFVTPSLRDGLPPPQGLKNLDDACLLIKEIVRAGKGIAVCCDFDVDGLSGGAQVYHFLTALGARAKVFVPDRFTDGYGLNERMIREIAEQKFSLVITVDYGTTNEKELRLAKDLGLKTIVIDHHHVEKIPPSADVFINPQQPGCGFAGGILCASGIAWYLLLGLKKHLIEASSLDPKLYLDLACLGTICDMVPLIGANRIIAKRGLELLTKTQRPGLQALKRVAGIHGAVECSHVGFGIGPRLNAAGRMVHGEVVIDLLTTSDSQLADKLADSLNRLNTERQEEEGRVKEVAIARVREEKTIPSGIVVWDPSFHTGVIGIVAQRMVETFYRPTVVLGADTEGIFKGSVRGIKGLSVVETLSAVSSHLIKFGGHEGAGGLSIAEENLETFRDAFIRECAKRTKHLDLEPHVEADTVAGLDEITPDLIGQLQQLAPFGVGNPHPQILVKKLTVKEVRSLKGEHLKTLFSDGSRYIPGLLWRHPQHPALYSGASVDIVCKPDLNSFRGVTEIVAHLNAVALCGN